MENQLIAYENIITSYENVFVVDGSLTYKAEL